MPTSRTRQHGSPQSSLFPRTPRWPSPAAGELRGRGGRALRCQRRTSHLEAQHDRGLTACRRRPRRDGSSTTSARIAAVQKEQVARHRRPCPGRGTLPRLRVDHLPREPQTCMVGFRSTKSGTDARASRGADPWVEPSRPCPSRPSPPSRDRRPPRTGPAWPAERRPTRVGPV